MKYLTIAFIAFWWLNTYSIPIGTSPYHPVVAQERYQFAIHSSKTALPVILLMNQELPAGTRVYGFWLEDHRAYCNFQLVGSIYGYGSHTLLKDVYLYEYLKSLSCEYLIYDEDRTDATAPYFRGRPYRVPGAELMKSSLFEECPEFYPIVVDEEGEEHNLAPSIKVWRLL